VPAPFADSPSNNERPIDGSVVLYLLQDTSGTKELTREITDCKKILDTKRKRYMSDDPLHLGMTLWTAPWFTGKEERATALTQRVFECLCITHNYIL